MTAEEEQMINETCQKAADRIEELQAQLSAKEQECEELKISVNNFTEMYQDKCNELASIRAENKNINDYCQGLTEDRDKLRKRCKDLEAHRVNIKKENIDLKHHCIRMEAERDNLQSIKNKLLSVKKELDQQWKENPQWTLYEYKKWAYDHIIDSLFDDENF